MVLPPVDANLCLTYLHLSLSSNQESRLKLIHRSDYDAGYGFQLDDQTIYIFLRISDPYLNKALLWTISNNEHENSEPQNFFEGHKPDTLNVFQQLITIIQYFCDVLKAPFPTELAAFERSYYDYLVEVCNDLDDKELFREIISGDSVNFSKLHRDLFRFWFELIDYEIVQFCNLLTTPSATELEMKYLEVAENQWSKTETLSATQKVETENATYIENSKIFAKSFTSNGYEIKNGENFRVKIVGNDRGIAYPYPSTTSNACESGRSSPPNDIKPLHLNHSQNSEEWKLLKNGTGQFSPKSSSLEVQVESVSEPDGTIPSNESKTLSPKSALSFQSNGSEIVFCDFEENEGSNYETPPSSPSIDPKSKKWNDILKSEDNFSLSPRVSFHSNETEEKLFVNTMPIGSSDFDWNSSCERSTMRMFTPPNSPLSHLTSDKFEVPEEMAYGGKPQRPYPHFSNPGADKAVANGKRARKDILASTDSNESSFPSPRKVKRLKPIQMRPIREESPTWLKISGLEAAVEEIKMRKHKVQMIHAKLVSLDDQVVGILKHLMEGVQFFGQLDSVSKVILQAYDKERKIQRQLEAVKTDKFQSLF